MSNLDCFESLLLSRFLFFYFFFLLRAVKSVSKISLSLRYFKPVGKDFVRKKSLKDFFSRQCELFPGYSVPASWTFSNSFFHLRTLFFTDPSYDRFFTCYDFSFPFLREENSVMDIARSRLFIQK